MGILSAIILLTSYLFLCEQIPTNYSFVIFNSNFKLPHVLKCIESVHLKARSERGKMESDTTSVDSKPLVEEILKPKQITQNSKF